MGRVNLLLSHIWETFSPPTRLLQDAKNCLNFLGQPGDRFKHPIECSNHPSSSTLPVNVAIGRHKNLNELVIVKEGGQEDALDDVVILFDDIFVGAIHEESIPKMSVNPIDWFACL